VRAERRPALAQPVAKAGPPLVEPVDRLDHRRGVEVEPSRELDEERNERRGKTDLRHG
jgi:hypothetical protein